MKADQLNINKFSTDKENEQIILAITNTLNNFCLGDYKDEPNYPIAMTNTKLICAAGEIEFNISFKLNKNKEGMLKHVNVSIVKLGER